LDRIFEPQVVSQPSAQKMSFWAMGMPVSAPASPGGPGLGQRTLGVHGDEGVQVLILINALQQRPGQLDAGGFLAGQGARQLGNGLFKHGVLDVRAAKTTL
jgi:hypothetical protein